MAKPSYPVVTTAEDVVIVESNYPDLGGRCPCGGEIDHVSESPEANGAVVEDDYVCKRCGAEYFTRWTSTEGDERDEEGGAE